MALKPINVQPRITEKSVKVSDLDLKKNSLSGDIIDGGTITHFNSTGIKDITTKNQVEIKDDVTNVYNDLFVRGKINVQTLQYNRAQVPTIEAMNAIRVGGNEVLWREKLGKSVKESSLQKVGILNDLEVKNTLYVKDGRVGINTTVPSKTFAVDADGVEVVIGSDDAIGFVGTHSSKSFAITTDDVKRIIVSANGKVSIQNSVVIENKLGIGVNNPEHDLEVAGNIKFADRIFSNGPGAPTEGTWTKGSIVWNQSPDIGKPIGWVCIKGGRPGAWRSFGPIN